MTNKSEVKKRHGFTKTRFYTIWVSMKQRCRDKKHACYKNISVCERWNNSFLNFKNDIISEFEIIGNIYENPELLGGENANI